MASRKYKQSALATDCLVDNCNEIKGPEQKGNFDYIGVSFHRYRGLL